MSTISYDAAHYPVRDDLTAAHARFWERLARPGAWWTAAERVAIAREVRAARDCVLCEQRKRALSPSGVDGEHDHATDLPAPAIEAIHRITTDASRLTRSWHEALIAAGLSQGQYVELLGTLVSLVSVDSFCRAIGVAPHPLPEPRAGAISRYRPPRLEDDDEAWLPMVPAVNKDTPEADLWVSGRTGYVIRAMSLVPDEVRTLADLGAAHYLPNRDVRSAGRTHREGLTRSQIELVAARVSLLNQCYY